MDMDNSDHEANYASCHRWPALKWPAESPGSLMIAQKTIWESLPRQNRGFTLGALLTTFNGQESTDVRDQVYGLLGLAYENSVKVDYDIYMENLYREVLRAISNDFRSRFLLESSDFESTLQRMLGLDWHISGGNIDNQREQLEVAEEVGIKVLKLRREMLGENHPRTLESIVNLVSIYERQGRLKEAEEMGVKVLGNRHEAVVKLLLGTDEADPDAKDKYGKTLARAAENGYEGIVKLLLGTGKVDLDAKDNSGRTPLMWAAENGHEAVVKLLLGTGKVNPDVKGKYGKTPLWWAAGYGQKAVLELHRQIQN
ncbi:hypothetical protein DL768_010959 [Monosporascus sp. mg162]|nr:hypothetical protein DL768_010959 [Monosporascus sp. mg162]